MESDNYFDSLNQVHSQLRGLDDRSLVLVMSAFAEDSLGDLLKSYMHDNRATKKLLDGYEAPLGNFSARISACYALGLITKGQYHDLDHLRSIRNNFSHTWRPISLDEEETAKHIKAINYSNVVDQYPGSLREKLEGSISFLLVEIKVLIKHVSEIRANKQIYGSRLYSGLIGNPEEQLSECIERLNKINQKLSSAKAEEKEFTRHLKLCWIEKYLRVVSKFPKEEVDKLLKDLYRYADPDDINLSKIYSKDR